MLAMQQTSCSSRRMCEGSLPKDPNATSDALSSPRGARIRR